MRDDGSVCGAADSKKLMEDIPNKARDALGLIVYVDLLNENGLDVIKITVEENPYPVNYRASITIELEVQSSFCKVLR